MSALPQPIKILVRVVVALIAALSLGETLFGAPQFASVLADAGVGHPRLVGVLLACGVALALGLIALGPHRVRAWLPGGDDSPPDGAAHAELVRTAQDELVAAIEDGNALAPGLREARHAPYTVWRDSTAAFLEAVFGHLERQRFEESDEPSSYVPNGFLKTRLKRLAALRDRPETWDLKVDADGVRRAVAQRRGLSRADRILVAGEPWTSRDDEAVLRGELDDWLRRGLKLQRELPEMGPPAPHPWRKYVNDLASDAFDGLEALRPSLAHVFRERVAPVLKDEPSTMAQLHAVVDALSDLRNGLGQK